VDPNRERVGTCKLCGRECSDVTEHHLIPRTTHKMKRFKKMHTREAMINTVTMCQPCHRAMHQFFSEKELAAKYYTIEKLLANEKIAKHVNWVKKQKPDFRMKRSLKGRAR